MSKVKIMGIIRHILTFFGGMIATLGYVEESVVLELSGGLVSVIGAVWSLIDKNKNKNED